MRTLLSTAIVFLGAVGSVGAGEAATAVYRGLKPDEFMMSWLLLSPIPTSTNAQPDDAAQKTAFATDFLMSAGGEGRGQPAAGQTARIAGKDYEWRLVTSQSDIIDLSAGITNKDFAVAYAWADIEMKQAATLLFGIGSDDAIKAWVNGKLVHETWVTRLVRKDDDLVKLPLQKGRNQLLLKIQNQQGKWGFVCRPLSSAGLVEKLVEAAGRGALDEMEKLLARGVSVSGKDKRGLTPWQAARIHGCKAAADLLLARGATARMPPKLESVVDATGKDIVRDDWPGAAVLVAQNGKILFEKGYGLANLEHRVPVMPETKFRIGSISKQFTASAILKLHEQGKLELDDKLSKFIPDFPRGDEVTIHHLLTHTSGIHSYTSKPDFIETALLFIKPGDLIRSFKNDPYDFDPGQKWSYNNSGFFLLGYIVEKVSGKPYEDFLRANFFEPLGMTNTGVHHGRDVLAHEAHGYAYEGGKMKKALNWDMSRAGGAGSLYSTVGDLYRWNEAVFNGSVLSEASLKAAFTPVKTKENENEKREEGYGYGWGIGKLRGLTQIHHGGGLNGFVSYLLRVTEEKLTVVVLVNASPTPPELDPTALANEIAQLYLAEKLEWRPVNLVNKSVSPQAFDACVGRYDYGAAILTVTREGDRLFAQMSGQGTYEIFPRSETEFFWQVVDAELTFVKDEKGVVIKAVHRQAGVPTINAPRLPDQDVARIDSRMLDACVGKYDYGGGQAILTVTREGDHLFAQLTGQPKFEIFQKSETEFFWKAVDAQITFVKDEKGKVTKGIHQQGGRKFDAPKIQ